jgi:hypothetical protein
VGEEICCVACGERDITGEVGEEVMHGDCVAGFTSNGDGDGDTPLLFILVEDSDWGGAELFV